MGIKRVVFGLAAILMLTICTQGNAADWGLKEGKADLQSAGQLAFGPDGVLIVGDAKAAAIFAIETGDTKGDASSVDVNVDAIDQKLAKLLGAKQTQINDLVVNAASGNVYFSVAADGKPALVRLDTKGDLSKLSLDKVAFAKVELSDAPADKVTGEGRRRQNNRESSITDLAYVDGKVIISGLSASESPSTVREIAFPFAPGNKGASIEIYHGAHGRLEETAVIRTFVPFTIDGEPSLLAGFTCTPLVKFPIDSLKPGTKVRGTTVAELGNRNRPLDVIVYQKDGKDYLLMANSARGVMKISTENIASNEGIEERINGTAGQPYETIEELKGVVQLDRLNDTSAVIVTQNESGSHDLRTIALP